MEWSMEEDLLYETWEADILLMDDSVINDYTIKNNSLNDEIKINYIYISFFK